MTLWPAAACLHSSHRSGKIHVLYTSMTALTLSILFPTSIFTRSFLVQYVSSSLSQLSSLAKVSRRVTSYTVENKVNNQNETKYVQTRSTSDKTRSKLSLRRNADYVSHSKAMFETFSNLKYKKALNFTKHLVFFVEKQRAIWFLFPMNLNKVSYYI